MAGSSQYTVALEQQLSLLRYLASPRGDSLLAILVEQGPGVSGIADERERLRLLRLMRDEVTESLKYGDTFYWAPEMCALLEQVAPSLPSWTCTRALLPSDEGFFWFASPLRLPEWDSDEGSAAPGMDLCALTWRYGKDAGRSGERVTEFVFFVRSTGRNAAVQCWPATFYPAVEGRIAGADLESAYVFYSESRKERWKVKLRYAGAALLCLQQRILVAPNRQLDRGTRRRLARESQSAPGVRVVELRKTLASSAALHQEERLWSCRWVVRGHWRQQPYGTGRAFRRPTWVLPHVKGPDDKPLKPPRSTVFAVVR